MFGKKRLARRMVEGVDRIKIILYTTLKHNIHERHSSIGEQDSNRLAAIVVNSIFGEMTQEDTKYLDDFGFQSLVSEEIVNLASNHPNFRLPITDALRVHIQAIYMLSGDPPRNWRQTVERATEVGLLQTDAAPPDPKTFQKMTERLLHDHGLT